MGNNEEIIFSSLCSSTSTRKNCIEATHNKSKTVDAANKTKAASNDMRKTTKDIRETTEVLRETISRVEITAGYIIEIKRDVESVGEYLVEYKRSKLDCKKQKKKIEILTVCNKNIYKTYRIISQVINNINEVRGGVKEVTDNITYTMKNIKKVIKYTSSCSKSDDALEDIIITIVSNLKDTSKNIKKAIRDIKDIAERINRATSNVSNTVLGIRDAIRTINNCLKNKDSWRNIIAAAKSITDLTERNRELRENMIMGTKIIQQCREHIKYIMKNVVTTRRNIKILTGDDVLMIPDDKDEPLVTNPIDATLASLDKVNASGKDDNDPDDVKDLVFSLSKLIKSFQEDTARTESIAEIDYEKTSVDHPSTVKVVTFADEKTTSEYVDEDLPDFSRWRFDRYTPPSYSDVSTVKNLEDSCNDIKTYSWEMYDKRNEAWGNSDTYGTDSNSGPGRDYRSFSTYNDGNKGAYPSLSEYDEGKKEDISSFKYDGNKDDYISSSRYVVGKGDYLGSSKYDGVRDEWRVLEELKQKLDEEEKSLELASKSNEITKCFSDIESEPWETYGASSELHKTPSRRSENIVDTVKQIIDTVEQYIETTDKIDDYENENESGNNLPDISKSSMSIRGDFHRSRLDDIISDSTYTNYDRRDLSYST